MKKLFIFGSTILIIIIFISAFIILEPLKFKKEAINQVEKQPVALTRKIDTSLPSGSEKIEVFVFHATQRCISCINIGKYTKSVIEEKFSEDLKSGKITFREVNIDLPENFKMAKDYGVSGSALYINAIKDGQDNHEEDTTVWRLVTDETNLKEYFEAKIKKLL